MMGKYIGKREGLGEIAVMEVAQVGVRTRACATTMAVENSGDEKRRKVISGGGDDSLVDQLIAPENSISTADSSDPCFNASSDHLSDSCCSSNGLTEEEEMRLADLKDENAKNQISRCNLDRRERREKSEATELKAKSGELESTVSPPEATSRRLSGLERMPPEAELEEFFATAEQNIHKKFTEKYNFNILKDVPLEGRYEWVKLKP